jgi:hypothetical protein
MYLSVNAGHDASDYVPQLLQWQVLDKASVAILLHRAH